MKDFLLNNSKTFLAIAVSFTSVFFVFPFFMTPGKITRTLDNFSSTLSSLKSSRFFSLNFSSVTSRQPSFGNAQDKPTTIPNNSFMLPTVYIKPTLIIPTNIFNEEDVREIPNHIIPRFSPTPEIFIPDDNELVDFPIENGDTDSLSEPTKKLKPTKAPDTFAIDPALARYGKTTDEVFTYAAQKTCVPKEVLRSIAAIESGGFFDVVDPKYFLLYNSYNWWNSQFLTEEKRACGGYDYDNGSGIVPSDSKYAGHNCHSDGSTGSQSYIMGPMQVTGSEQTKFASQVKSALGGGVKQIDRRVILDAILIVGFVSKQNVNPSSCTNWTAQQVAKAACGYYGSCGFKDGTYYCNTFCRNYKTYGGKTDCQGAVNKMQDNCWQ